MNIAFIGCGFVFDIYMRTLRAHPELVVKGVFDINTDRIKSAKSFYGFHGYSSIEELLADPDVEIVVNLTNIASHFEVTKAALEAGKHVYSEKPLTKNLEESKALYKTADTHNVRLYAAPCNIYSDSIRTLFKAVEAGTIGTPLLVYAELDDNPIHFMEFENVKSPRGTPWPLIEEIREGCTYEHLGYHLVWICGLLGPAKSIVAYSSELITDKTHEIPGKSGTPDYSVVNLHFETGASARITCSVVAPRDHRMRVIGYKGELSTDSYRQYRAPVFLENYSKTSLNARKFRIVRAFPLLGSLLGVGGRKLPLVRNWKSHAVERDQQSQRSLKQRAIEWLRRNQVYAQDKLVGVAEMAREIKNEEPQYLSPDFVLHINELTLLTQAAGPDGIAVKPTTTFKRLGKIPGTQSL